MLQIVETPNRHVAFMQGLAPTLETFSDDKVLEFQAGALNLIQKIKAKRNPPVYSSGPPLTHRNQPSQSYGWGHIKAKKQLANLRVFPSPFFSFSVLFKHRNLLTVMLLPIPVQV